MRMRSGSGWPIARSGPPNRCNEALTRAAQRDRAVRNPADHLGLVIITRPAKIGTDCGPPRRSESLVSGFTPRRNGRAVKRKFPPLKPLFNGEPLRMTSLYYRYLKFLPSREVDSVKPLVSPQIAHLLHCLPRAGSPRRLVHRHSQLREAITETAAPRRAATLRQEASRMAARPGAIGPREDEPWA
jgi:hypothetical protein